jgi:hypothetical protein
MQYFNFISKKSYDARRIQKFRDSGIRNSSIRKFLNSKNFIPCLPTADGGADKGEQELNGNGLS